MAAVYFTGEGAHDGRENWAVARRVLILYGAHLSLHECIALISPIELAEKQGDFTSLLIWDPGMRVELPRG